MSKVALKITRKALNLADSLYDVVLAKRVKALYNELAAVRGRNAARHEAERRDNILAHGIVAELDELEGDNDEAES